MKIRSLFTLFAIISAFTLGQAFANETKKDAAAEPAKAKCCANAEKDGKKCGHGCCAAPAKDGKNCEKCGGTNPVEAKK